MSIVYCTLLDWRPFGSPTTLLLMSTEITQSARILLSEIIDYAGLFPPARLAMPDAVINYATYQNSNYRWMLGRFIVPVGRLDEFIDSARDFFSHDHKNGVWRLSVLASDDVYDTVRKVEDFNAVHAPAVMIDTLEVKAASTKEIEKISEAIPDNFSNFFEIPIGDDFADLVSALAVHDQSAKIRTGGVNSEDFPKSAQIIRFIRTCMAANIRFKATAGLHHPIRCFRPLTYESNSAKASMHGFLNLFLATGFARQGFKPPVLEEILEEEFEEVFVFDGNGAYWQKDHFINIQEIEELREKAAVSFGSCSFEDPISDLQEIGIL